MLGIVILAAAAGNAHHDLYGRLSEFVAVQSAVGILPHGTDALLRWCRMVWLKSRYIQVFWLCFALLFLYAARFGAGYLFLLLPICLTVALRLCVQAPQAKDGDGQSDLDRWRRQCMHYHADRDP